MMYATGKDFIVDFAKRTQVNYLRCKNSSYEVTLLINSAVGLLILPQQQYMGIISNNMIDEDLLKQLQECVVKNTYPQVLNLAQIVRHLRNAIAHNHIEAKAEEPSTSEAPLEIHSIRFWDKYGASHFEIDIPIILLEKFFLSFSDAVISLK